MKSTRVLKPLLAIALIAGAAFAGYSTRERWLPLLNKPVSTAAVDTGGEEVAPTGKVIVNDRAQHNLGLSAKPLKPQTYWKTIQVPGMVVDRPGVSDRGVVAPVTGVVVKVNHVPGDIVRPGDALFTLKILSESLHLAQSELAKATRDVELANAERKLLVAAAAAVAEARIIEVDNRIIRLQSTIKAYRQELLNRSLSPEMIDAVAAGQFVNEMTIAVPPKPADLVSTVISAGSSFTFEVQELKAELGQQVQAGQLVCVLANHRKLTVEGRAFRDETPLLEKSVRESWPVEVDFQEDAASADWGEIKQEFRIRYLANTIDPVNRTFAFQMPLENPSRIVDGDGKKLTLWRFRPGQKVRLLVRVEKLDNVFVLPADAVAREGADAFVFTQNSNTFERVAVRVLLQDRREIVLANDGSLPVGSYVVQGGAAQLNRMVKAGGGGVPKGYHIHADGSLHKNEDEGK